MNIILLKLQSEYKAVAGDIPTSIIMYSLAVVNNGIKLSDFAKVSGKSWNQLKSTAERVIGNKCAVLRDGVLIPTPGTCLSIMYLILHDVLTHGTIAINMKNLWRLTRFNVKMAIMTLLNKGIIEVVDDDGKVTITPSPHFMQALAQVKDLLQRARLII